jgi:hypothetical protein
MPPTSTTSKRCTEPSPTGLDAFTVDRANPPHKFATGTGGYEAVHIHANAAFVTDWLE